MGCGESKHVATKNTISRNNSRAGSKRVKTPETIEATSKLDTNANSLMKEESKSFNQDPGADNSKGMTDGNGMVKSTEYAEMGCGESKNTISRKNSRAGSKRGQTWETFEEENKFDRSTSSLMKSEGENVNQDSGADNSRGMTDGNGIAESRAYVEMGCGEPKHVVTGNTVSRRNSRTGFKRGKTPEIIDATSKLDRSTSSSTKEEGKRVYDQDSAAADNSRTVANGNGIAESTEYAEMAWGEPKHVATGDRISRKNSIAESKEDNKTPETMEETRKLDRNTSSLIKEEGKSVNDHDSGANNSKVVADGKDIADSTELKKQENVENDNEEKQNGFLKENEEPIDDLAFEAFSGSSGKESLSDENLKVADTLEDKKFAEEITTKGESKEDAKEETVKDLKLVEEKKEEIANGELETAKVENSIKETETAETTEDKVSTPVVQEEEKPARSPAKDSKTE